MSTKILLAATLSAVCIASVQAAPLSFKSKTIEAQSCSGKDNDGKPICHKQTVAYPITGDKNLDAWVKAQWKGKLPTQKSVQAELDKSEDVSETNQSNKTRGKDEYPCALDYVNTLELEGYTPKYAVFGEEDWRYECGAHGNGAHALTVLPRNANNPKKLKLKDILLPKQHTKLVALQKEAYIKYLQKEAYIKYPQKNENNTMSEKEARAYVSAYNNNGFKGTDNWRFGKNSIVFLFQSYEIGPYALGRPELAIPVKDLRGIVKPEILREATQYQTNPSLR